MSKDEKNLPLAELTDEALDGAAGGIGEMGEKIYCKGCGDLFTPQNDWERTNETCGTCRNGSNQGGERRSSGRYFRKLGH